MKKHWKALSAGLVLGLASYLIIGNYATVLAYLHGQQLTREVLDESLELGKQFLIANQKAAGNFNYEYDFINDRFTPGDSQVRQAGALWGVTLCHQEIPSRASREAVEKGIDFFESISPVVANGRYVAYPGENSGRTGTVALVTLSLIDFIRAEPEHPRRPHYDSLLNGYIRFLLSLREASGVFAAGYSVKSGSKHGQNSPYFDGETLLALSRAANYLGYDSLKAVITSSAEYMYQHHVINARAKDVDSNQTKGFYQWSSMSFYEIYKAGWGDHWAPRTIELADWMIDTHKTLFRTRNTAYAYEGLASAYELARLSGDSWAQKKIGAVIDVGLGKLITWQVGGPLQDSYLRNNPPVSEIAVGGVINRGMMSSLGIIYGDEWPYIRFFNKNEPLLRIDVTQHQCHAIILAKRFIYDQD